MWKARVKCNPSFSNAFPSLRGSHNVKIDKKIRGGTLWVFAKAHNEIKIPTRGAKEILCVMTYPLHTLGNL